MASRYWIGGAGTWDASTTTNWSATSGGAGGASAPTSADDVIFDANSDAGGIFTVTIGTGAVCRDITAGSLDFTMTLAGTGGFAVSQALTIHGSLSFPVTNLTATLNNIIIFASSTAGKTINTNGVSLGNSAIIRFSGSGSWSLSAAFTFGSFLEFLQGTFTTNNFNLTGGSISTPSASSITINAGSSTISLSGNFTANFTASNLIFNAGTSQINLSAASPNFMGGGLTFYNVSFTSIASGTHTITGANTFNNITFTSLASTGIRNISISANQTVNGTLTLGAANTAIRRLFMRSDTVGTARTITAAAIATLADVDFRDIANAGATWTGTRLGNCLGNSGITFDAGKTVYWNNAAGGGTGTASWALTSGGAASENNFPLAQDTAIVENTGLNTLAQITHNANWNYGTLDMSTRSNAMTLFNNANPNFYGNITYSSAVTNTGVNSYSFVGTGNQTVTSAGVTIPQTFIVEKAAGALVLGDALTTTQQLTLTRGTLDLNNFDLTCLTFSSSNSNTRSIAFGTGEINVTGNATTIFVVGTVTNFSYTGIPNINFTYSGGAGTRNIETSITGGTEANSLNFNVTAGTDIFAISSVFNSLNFTGFSGTWTTGSVNRTVFGNLTVSTGMTITGGNGAYVFQKSTSTQTITTNGKTLDFPVTKSGAGTLQLLDDLTIGSTRTLTHTAGTIDLNDFDLTTGLYSSTGSTARQLDVGSGTFTNSGATFTVSGSNYTTAGTGSISMTSASSKTFAGGGFSYPTLNQGGAGALNVTGANTFANLTNTTQPAIINLPASTVTNCANVNTIGDATNQVTLQSSSSGTRATINLTTADVDTKYTTIKDINVTGSYKFNAYTQSGTADSIGNVNNGNNNNVVFTPTGGLFMVVM